MRRRVLDIYVNKVEVDYNKETQQHTVDIHFRYPMYKSEVEYTRDNKSKMRWDKWGKIYRIKKGKQLVSLSDFKKKSDSQSSNLCVETCHSTVTDLARLRG